VAERTLNPSGHTDDCSSNSDQPCADPKSTHVDIFCEGCHDWFDEPHVLPNGTDVAWPSNWTRKEADYWRAQHNLTRPGDMPAAGPHDAPDLVNPVSTAGTGMLPEVGNSSQDDMAPGG